MWSTVEIAGRPAEIFEPDQPFAGVVIYLHGYAGESLREHPALVDLFQQYRLAVVRPSGGRSWWVDQSTPEFPQTTPMQYVRKDVMEWIKHEWQQTAPQVALFGVSMGGQGVLNLAYRHARQFPVVAALSPAIEFHLIHGRGWGVEEIFPDAELARQETVTLHLHPLDWPRRQFFCSDPEDRTWHDGCVTLASKLSSTGVPYECDLTTSRGGHGWAYFTAMAPRAVAFVSDGLSQLRESPDR